MSDERIDDPQLARYARQMRFAGIGVEGQRRLLASRVLIAGCGALGSTLAGTLVRSGVGHVRLVDRDFVELSNLQRQALFDEDDARQALPKAVAAATRLRSINSQVEIEPIVTDMGPDNIGALLADVDVIVDGTDNFETRFLLNDAALRHNVPFVFGGCIGCEGQTMTIVPGETPCLRCLIPEPPAAGTTATCDTAGIVAPVVGVIASLEAQEALKILSGRRAAVRRQLLVVDLWENRWRQVGLDHLRNSSTCPACRGEYEWLSGQRGSQTVVLCGRNSVQIRPSTTQRLSLDELAARLAAAAPVERNAYLARATIEGFLLTVFADGRAIIGGTDDPSTARAIYSRWVGM